ncbi:hypothetical protein Afe04nite_70040 [Asanoa ferruginea]|uniref:S1 family peptidase n=1 Tax=Asanoa ferruginea TaxID=53367 RepID=UPI0011C0D8C1|nr:S1 family peptidase [Asanoa ferruginea]GIF52465.1 hypothetical protein Afe04nite_70040 [Asanoa ferruginea]
MEEYKVILADVLNLPGVVFIDADENCQCAVVGVTNQSIKAAVLSFASLHGVPSSALQIEETSTIDYYDDLSSKVRPAKGGLRVENEDGAYCTMTAVVFSSALQKKGLLTNSHCTRSRNSVDGIEFFQAGGALFSSDFIAREAIDPAGFTRPEVVPTPMPASGTAPAGCPTGRICRLSDAAFASFDSSTVGVVGQIAKPIATCTLTPCSSVLGSPNDFLQISDVMDGAAQGIAVEKVGFRTGQTRGEVTRTCVNANAPDSITLLCQYFVAAAADHGDSGSPVFVTESDGSVRLIGVLWGGPVTADGSTPTSYVFSSIMNLDTELGGFEYHE